MTDRRGGEELSFAGRGVPEGFARSSLVLAPGGARPYDAGEWGDALVSVESGELTLECTRGGARTFGRGSLLPLGVLPLRWLRNHGDVDVLLVAVKRQGCSTSRANHPSAPT